MYKIVYLPLAKTDIQNILNYISDVLGVPNSALNLLEKFEKSISYLQDFPYSHSIYSTKRTLKNKYRFIPVKNYIIFYNVIENKKTVEISRVIYAKRNLEKLI